MIWHDITWQRKKILNESVQSQHMPVQSDTISRFLHFADKDLHQKVCMCRFAHWMCQNWLMMVVDGCWWLLMAVDGCWSCWVLWKTCGRIWVLRSASKNQCRLNCTKIQIGIAIGSSPASWRLLYKHDRGDQQKSAQDKSTTKLTKWLTKLY